MSDSPSPDSLRKRFAAWNEAAGGPWGLAGILALCAVIAALRWVKLESLYNVDPSMWLSQVGRLADGEMPYRDFSWNYPPLTIYLLGWTAKLFGITFGVIQAAVDVISLAVVVLAWYVARLTLPPQTRFVTIAGMVAICATSVTKFNLFSFATYSVSLEIAAAGLLMIMAGGVRQLRNPVTNAGDFTLLAGGAFITSVTKPEAAIAAWGALILLFLFDNARRRGWYAWICGTAAIPAIAIYAWVGFAAGFERLKAGVGGYGLASFACPWWPTGLGVFGAIAVIGEAAFIAAVLLLPVRKVLRPERAANMRGLWLGGAVGLVVFAGYVWYQCRDVFLNPDMASVRLESIARAVIWTSPALLPFMWASICMWPILFLRRNRLSVESRVLCFALSVPVIMSIRSLFGTTLFPFTEVSAMCYPFFAIAAAWLIEGLYGWAVNGRSAAPTVAIWIMLGGYGVLRFAGAYSSQLSNENFYSLETRAGTVRLSDGHISEEIYRYVLENTRPGDTLLDLPYGGGFNFAARMKSPAFTTQYQQLRMPPAYQAQDLDGVLKHRPALVIAVPGPRFQTTLGYAANMACPFPRLVWEPDQPSWEPGYVFPVVDFLEREYHVIAEIGPKIILGPGK